MGVGSKDRGGKEGGKCEGENRKEEEQPRSRGSDAGKTPAHECVAGQKVKGKEVCHKCGKKEEEERKNTSASLKSRSTKSHVGRQAAAELSVG